MKFECDFTQRGKMPFKHSYRLTFDVTRRGSSGWPSLWNRRYFAKSLQPEALDWNIVEYHFSGRNVRAQTEYFNFKAEGVFTFEFLIFIIFCVSGFELVVSFEYANYASHTCRFSGIDFPQFPCFSFRFFLGYIRIRQTLRFRWIMQNARSSAGEDLVRWRLAKFYIYWLICLT